MALPCDVTDKAACEAASDVLVKAWGTIDILVNVTSQAISFACRCRTGTELLGGRPARSLSDPCRARHNPPLLVVPDLC